MANVLIEEQTIKDIADSIRLVKSDVMGTVKYKPSEMTNAILEGCDQRYNSGINEGYQRGKAEGEQIGWQNGYTQGSSEGYERGYKSGMYDFAIMPTVEDESLTITDSIEYPPLDMTVFGKSTQDTYEGNQLFDGNLTNSMTDSNGGTNFNATTLYLGFSKKIECIVGNTYTVKFFGYSDTKNINVAFWNEDTFIQRSGISLFGSSSVNISENTVTGTLTVPEGATYMHIYIYDSNGPFTDLSKYKIMLNKGSTALPFELYVGNKPSPSIDYPQEVTSHGDKGSIEYGLHGKNLYIGRYYIVGISGGKSQILNDDEVIFPYTPSNYGMGVGKIIPCKAGVTYAISARKINANATIRYTEYNDIESAHSKDNSISHKDNNSANSLVYTAKTNGVLLVTVCGIWDSGGNHLIHTCTEDEEIQVEISSVVSEYEAPKEPQPLTILTPNGLRGIPIGTTIPDTIKNSEIHMRGVYWDEEDGQYYIADTREYGRGKDVQRIIHDNVKGSQNIYMNRYENDINSNFNTSFFFCYTNSKKPSISRSNAMSPCLPNNGYIYVKDVEGIYVDGNYASFRIGNDLLDNISTQDKSIESLKSILNDTPIEYWYILETPIETDISEEEIEQYNSLTMNYPNTTILNNENAHTSIQYIADTNKYLKNLTNAILTEGGNV